MLCCRFYLGVVTYRSEEFQGQHEAIVEPELFERVQRRKSALRPPRAARKTGSVLAGRVRCARPLWADRKPSGVPRYREQHGQPCANRARSVDARDIDDQVGLIFGAVELRPELLEAAVAAATSHDGGVERDALVERRRRLARAYADGAFSNDEYDERAADLDARIRAATAPAASAIEDAAGLLRSLPQLWELATPQERRRLIAPLLEHIYVDVDAKRVSGLDPAPAFRKLLEGAVQSVEGAAVRLLPPAGLPAEAREGGVWWRRGRIELPVQNTSGSDLLRV